MKRAVTRIVVVLLLVVMLPVLFYISDRVNSLSKNEQIIGQVFNKQLASILVSINQHSENIIKQWAIRLSIPVDSKSDIMQGIASDLLATQPSIEEIRFLNADGLTELSAYQRNVEAGSKNIIPQHIQISVLKDYINNNYQKIETVTFDGKIVWYFLSKNSNNYNLILIKADAERFIVQNLRAEIQRVAQELFYIEIQKTASSEVVFSTESNSPDSLSLQKSELWYLPEFNLGIRLKTTSIQEMVAERTKKESYSLWALIVFVLGGTFFIFWNIRKEIKLAEMKSEFVSNVSHEIRTPLALISMYTETLLLKRFKTEEKHDEYLKTIHVETQRLSEMVNRILSFSKMEKNKRKFSFEQLDVNLIVPEVIKSFEAQITKNSIECTFHPDSDAGTIHADRDALIEVLYNLIDNAIKYGRDTDARISIRSKHSKKSFLIEVEDNGPGIPAKAKKYIFDKFYRVTEGTLAHKAKGSGLGLNIVKQIMKAHHGTVTVQSKVGEGSCFRLKFPTTNNNHHD